jgi:transmembrane sensor
MSVRQEDRRHARRITKAVLVSILCRDEQPLSPQLQDRILKWMRHSSERVGDTLKAERFVQDLDELKLLNRGAQLAPSKPRPRGLTIATRRAVLIGGAAVIALSTALLISTTLESNEPIRHLTLEDGSVAHVLRGSDFSVKFDGEVRLIQLPVGEAVFEVAKDPERPFIVRSQVSDAIAVGTRFGVVANSAETTTTVSEGEVRVVVPAGAHPSRGRAVRAGEEIRVVAGTSQPATVTTVDAERKMLWSAGWLEFQGETLGEAARTFNRMNDVRIEITRPDLAEARLTYGRFKIDQPESFAALVGTMPNVMVTIDSKRGVIYIGGPPH